MLPLALALILTCFFSTTELTDVHQGEDPPDGLHFSLGFVQLHGTSDKHGDSAKSLKVKLYPNR